MIKGIGYGAFSKTEIKCGTIFGPYEGKIAFLDEMTEEEHCIVNKYFRNKYNNFYLIQILEVTRRICLVS